MSLDPFLFSGARGSELDETANYGVEPVIPMSEGSSISSSISGSSQATPPTVEETVDLSDPTVYVRDPFWYKKPAGQRPVEDAKALFLENLLKNKEATVTKFKPNGESYLAPLRNRDGTPNKLFYEYVEKANTFFNVANQDPDAGVQMNYETGGIVAKDYGNKIMSEEFVKGFNPFAQLGDYIKDVNASGGIAKWEEYVDMVNADSKSENSMIDPENKDLAQIFYDQAIISMHDFSQSSDPIQKVRGEWHINPGALLDIAGTDAAIDANKELSKYEKTMLKLNRDQMIEAAGKSAIDRFGAIDSDLYDDLVNYMNDPSVTMKDFVLENAERLDSKNYGLISQLFETTITAAAMFPGGIAALSAAALEKMGATDWADKVGSVPILVSEYHDAKMAAFENNELFELWGARFRTQDFTELFGQVASFGGVGATGALTGKIASKLGAKGATRYGTKYLNQVADDAAAAAEKAMQQTTLRGKLSDFGMDVLKDKTAYMGATQAAGMSFGSEFNAQIASGATRDEAMHKASIGAVANGLSAFIATGVMNRFGFGAEAPAQGSGTAQSIFARIKARGISREGKEAVIQLMRDLNASEALRRQVVKGIVGSMDNAAKKLGLKGYTMAGGLVSESIEEAADEAIGDFLSAALDHSENWNDEVWGNINEKFQDYFKAGFLGLFGGLGGEFMSFTGQALSGRSRYFKGDTAAVKAFRDKWRRFEVNIDEFKELRTASSTTSSDGAMTVAEVLASDQLTEEEKVASIVDAAISNYSTVADREVDLEPETVPEEGEQPAMQPETPVEAPTEPLDTPAEQEPTEAPTELQQPAMGQETTTAAPAAAAAPADPNIQAAIAPKLAEAGIKQLSGDVPVEYDEKNSQKGKNGQTVTPIHIGASGRNLAARVTYDDGSEIIVSAEEAAEMISTKKKTARQQKARFQTAAKRKLTLNEREQWAETETSDGDRAEGARPVSEGARDAGVPQGDLGAQAPVDSRPQPTPSDQPVSPTEGLAGEQQTEVETPTTQQDGEQQLQDQKEPEKQTLEEQSDAKTDAQERQVDSRPTSQDFLQVVQGSVDASTGAPTMKRHVRENKPEGATGDNGLWLENEGEMVTEITMSREYLADLKRKHNGDRGKMREQYHKDLAAVVATIAKEQGVKPSEIELPSDSLRVDDSGNVVLADNRKLSAATNEELDREGKADVVDEIDRSATLIVTERELSDSDKAVKDTETDTETALKGRRWVPTYKDNNTEKPPNGYRYRPSEAKTLLVAPGEQVIVKNSEGETTGALVFIEMVGGEYLFAFHSVQDLATSLASDSINESNVPENWRESKLDALPDDVKQLIAKTAKGKYGEIKREEKIKIVKEILKIISPYIRDSQINFTSKVDEETLAYVHREQIFINLDNFFAKIAQPYTGVVNPTQFAADVMAEDVGRRMAAILSEEVIHVHAVKIFTPDQLFLFYQDIVSLGEGNPLYEKMLNILQDRFPDRDTIDLPEEDRAIMESVAHEMLRALVELRSKGETSEDAYYEALELSKALNMNRSAGTTEQDGGAMAKIRAIGAMVARYARRVWRMLDTRNKMGLLSPESRRMLNSLSADLKKYGVDIDVDRVKQNQLKQTLRRAERVDAEFINTIEARAGAFNEGIGMLRRIASIIKLPLSIEGMLRFDPERGLVLRDSVVDILKAYPNPEIDLSEIQRALDGMNRAGFDERPTGKGESSFAMAQDRLMAFYQVAESALENLNFDPTEFFNLLPADLESIEEGSEAGRIGLRSQSIFNAITSQKIGRGEVEGLLTAILDQRGALLDDIDQLREERSAHTLQIIANLDLTQWQDRNKIYRVARRLGLVDSAQLIGDDVSMDAMLVQNQVITHLKSAIASGDYSVPPIGGAETLTAYNEKLANLKSQVRQLEFSHATIEALLEVTGTTGTVAANKKIVATLLKSKELLKNVDETFIDNFVDQILDTQGQVEAISNQDYEQLLSYLQAQNRFNIESKMLFNRAIGDFGVDRKGFAQEFIPKDSSENIDDVPSATNPNEVFGFDVHTDPAVLTEKAMMPGGAFPDRAPVRKEKYKASEVAIREAELKKAFDDERRRVESNAQYIGRLMKERALIAEGLGQMPSSIREEYMMNGGFALEYTSGGESGRLKYESEWEAFPRLDHSGAFGSALRGLFSENKDAEPPSAEDLANIISLLDNIDPWVNGVRKRIGQDAQLEIIDAGQMIQDETLAGRARKLLVPVLNALMSEKDKPNGFVADMRQRIDSQLTKAQQKELIKNPEAAGKKYGQKIEAFFADIDSQYNAIIKPKYSAFRDLLKQANQSVSLTRESLRAFRDPRWERNIIRDIERKERDPSYVTENPRVEALGNAAFDFRLYRNASFMVNYFSKDNPMYFDAFFAKDILRSHPNMGEGYELSLPAGSLRPSISSDEEIELYKQKVNERKARGLETPADMPIRIYGDQTIYVRPYDPKQDNQPGAAPLDAEYVTLSDINAEVSRGASATGMVSEETGGLGGGIQRVMVNRNREDQMFGSTDILGSPMLESSNTVLAVMNDLLPTSPFDQDTSLRSTAAEMAARNFGDPEVRKKLWWTTTAMFIGSRDAFGNIDLESARNYLNMGSRLKRGDYDRDLPATHSDSYSGAYDTFVRHTIRGLFPRMEQSQYNLLVKSFYRQFGKSGMTTEGVDVETLILDAAQFKMKFEQDQLRFERDKLSDNITMAFRSAMAPLTASIEASGIEGSDIAYLETVDSNMRESMVTALDNYKELVQTARDSERFLEGAGINPENIKSELESGRLPSGFDLESQMEIASFLNWLRLQPRDSELVDVQTLDADSLVDGGFNSNGEVGIATSNPAIDALLQNPVKNYSLRNGNEVSQRTIIFMPSEMTMNAFKLVNRKPIFIEGIGGLPNVIFAPQVQSEADSQAGVKLMLEKQILQSANRSETIANEVSSLASKIREAMDIAVNAQTISSQADTDILELAEQHQKQIRAGRSVDKSILDAFPEFNTLSGDERMIMKLWVKDLYETGVLYHPGGGYENVKKKYKDLERVKEGRKIVDRGLLDQIRYNDMSEEAALLRLKIDKTLRRRLNSYRRQRKALLDASINNVTAMDKRYRELAEKAIDRDPNYSKLVGDDRQIAISILNMHYQRTRTLLDRGELETGVWTEESDARLIAEVMTNKTAREIFDAGYLGQEVLAATGLSETSQFAIRSGISQILSPLSQGDARSIDRLQQWQQDSLMARQEEPLEVSAEEFTNVSNFEALKELMSAQEMGKSFSQSTYNTFVTLTALQKQTTPEKLLSTLPNDRLLPSDVALINAFNAIIGEAKQLNGETTEAQRIKSAERDQRDSEDKYAELLEQRTDAAGPIWSTENTRPTFTTDPFPKSWYLGSARLFNIPRASGSTMPTIKFNKRRIAEISANIYGNIESISNRVEESRNNGQARRLFENALKRVKAGRIESVNQYKGGMIVDIPISNNLLQEMEEQNPAGDIQNVLNDIRNVYAQMESDYESLNETLVDLNSKRDYLSKDSGWIFRDRLLADKKTEANKRIDQLLNDLVELKKAKGDQFSNTDSKLFKSRLNKIKKDLAEDRKSLASIGLEELTTQAERYSDSVRSRVAEDVYNFLQNIVLPSPELSQKMDDAQMNVAFHWSATMANDKIVGDYLLVMGRIRRKIKNNFSRITQRREAGQDEIALAKDNEVLQKSISNYNAYVNLMNARINELIDEVYAKVGIRTKPDYKALHMRKVVLSGDQSLDYQSMDRAFNDSLRRTTPEGEQAEAASVLMAGNRGLLNSFVRERLAEYLPKAKLKSPSDRKAAAIRRGYFANNLRNMLYDRIGNPNSKTEIESALYDLVITAEQSDVKFESAENERIYEAAKEIMNEFVLNTAEIKSLIYDRVEDLEGNTDSQAKTASQLRLMREADEKIKETENEINQLETAMLHKWGREPKSYNVDPETLREIRESLREKQTARYYHRFQDMYELDDRGNPVEGSGQDFEASVYINFVPEFKGDKTMAEFSPEVRDQIDNKWHEDESLRKEHIARLEALESSAQMMSEEAVDDIYKALRGTKEFVKTYDPRRLYGRAIDLVKAADAAVKSALEEERESYIKLMAEGLARETDPDIGGRLAQLNYALEGEAPSVKSLRLPKDLRDRSSYLGRLLTDVDGSNPILLIPKDAKQALIETFPSITPANVNKELKDLVLYNKVPSAKGSTADRKRGGFMNFRNKEWKDRPLGNNWQRLINRDLVDDVITVDDNLADLMQNVKTRREAATLLSSRLEDGVLGYYNARRRQANNQLEVEDVSQIEDVKRSIDLAKDMIEKIVYAIDHQAITEDGLILFAKTLKALANPNFSKTMNGTASNLDQLITGLDLTKSFSKAFSLVEGSRIMKKLTAGLVAFNPNNELFPLARIKTMELFHHQDARIRMRFARKQSAIQTAVELQAFLEEGFNGASGRDAAIAITKDRQEIIARSGKKLGNSSLNHSIAYVIAQLEGLKDAQGMDTFAALESWLETMEAGIHDSSVLAEVQQDKFNFVTRFFKAQAIDTVRQLPAAEKIMQVLKSAGIESVNKPIANNLRQAKAEELIKKAKEALLGSVDTSGKIKSNDVKEHADTIYRELKNLYHGMNVTRAIFSIAGDQTSGDLQMVPVNEESKRETVSPFMRSYGSVPLRRIHAANPSVESRLAPEGRYITDPEEMLSLKDSHFYSGLGRQAYDRQVDEQAVLRPINVDGVNSPISIVEDSVYRMNVQPNYQIIRQMVGRTVLKNGVPRIEAQQYITTSGAVAGTQMIMPDLLSDDIYANEQALAKQNKDGSALRALHESRRDYTKAMAAVASEIENTIQNDSQIGVVNTDFSNQMRRASSLFVVRALVSAQQLWNQGVGPSIGYMIKKIAVGDWASAVEFASTLGELFRSAVATVPLEAYNRITGKEDWRRKDGLWRETTNFIKRTSPYTFYRAAEGHDIVRASARNQVRYKGNKVRNVASKIANMFESVGETSLQFAIGSPERLLARAIYIVELRQQLRKYDGDSNLANLSLEELIKKEAKDIPVYAKQYARIKVTDMMGQSDESKKSWFFQNRSKNPLESAFWRNVARFSNHTATTASNMSAMIPTIFMGTFDKSRAADAESRKEAIENAVGTLSQNFLFHILKWNTIVPLAVWAWQSMFGDDDDEDPMLVANKISKDIFGTEDDGMTKTVMKELMWGKYRPVMPDTKNLRAGEASMLAELSSKFAIELTQAIPYLGVLFGYSSIQSATAVPASTAVSEEAWSKITGIDRGEYRERNAITVRNYQSGVLEKAADLTAPTSLLFDYGQAVDLTIRGLRSERTELDEHILPYILTEIAPFMRDARNARKQKLKETLPRSLK